MRKGRESREGCAVMCVKSGSLYSRPACLATHVNDVVSMFRYQVGSEVELPDHSTFLHPMPLTQFDDAILRDPAYGERRATSDAEMPVVPQKSYFAASAGGTRSARRSARAIGKARMHWSDATNAITQCQCALRLNGYLSFFTASFVLHLHIMRTAGFLRN